MGQSGALTPRHEIGEGMSLKTEVGPIEEQERYAASVLLGAAQSILNDALRMARRGARNPLRPRSVTMLEQAVKAADEAQRSLTWEGEEARR